MATKCTDKKKKPSFYPLASEFDLMRYWDGIDLGPNFTERANLQEELSFVTLTIHLCNGLNNKNLVKPRKTYFIIAV